MKAALFLIGALVSINAFAAETEWNLVRKTQGPAAWTCPETVKLALTNERMDLTWAPHSPIILDQLNGKAECSELNSGHILKGVRCGLNTLESGGDEIVITQRECVKEGFWHKSCDPKGEEPSTVVAVKGNGTLTVTQLINWQNAPYFGCEYSKQ